MEKKIEKYFKPIKVKWFIIMFLVGLIILGKYNTASIILMVFAIGAVALQIVGRASTKEIDQCAVDKLGNLMEKAMFKSGVDDEQVDSIPPITLVGYDYRSNWDANSIKVGSDKVRRSKIFTGMVFLFSDEQLYFYENRFSLVSNKYVEETEEFFYSDITNISTSGLPDGGESFELTTSSGNKISAVIGTESIAHNPDLQRSINGLKQLVRIKRQQV